MRYQATDQPYENHQTHEQQTEAEYAFQEATCHSGRICHHNRQRQGIGDQRGLARGQVADIEDTPGFPALKIPPDKTDLLPLPDGTFQADLKLATIRRDHPEPLILAGEQGFLGRNVHEERIPDRHAANRRTVGALFRPLTDPVNRSPDSVKPEGFSAEFDIHAAPETFRKTGGKHDPPHYRESGIQFPTCVEIPCNISRKHLILL